ncbi:MAG: hypothetical protein QGI24_01515 [Kiritimatiellia bacterium]|nr:hypothetical protein [Kiritimatiellia bacterium]MDP6847441.1 hypothetical protein [Kiritimatiellia bacterium]
MRRYYLVFFVLLGMLTSLAHACSVPVFRYALERWPADYYGAMVIHKGPLSEAENSLLEEFKEGVEQDDAFLNVEVFTKDLADPEAGELDKLLGDLVPEKLPAVALWYPWRMQREPPVLVWDFSAETVTQLLKSPAREEIVKRIIDGDSAVWLFVESENAETNKITLARINEELKAVEIELKEMQEENIDPETEGLVYKFSVMSISRSDPEEKALIEMLMKSEEDLHEHKALPMVFPMYGQGRALFALIGEGINSENIRDVVGFLTGPCSCQVKSMNPGTDIMMPANWEKAIMDKTYVSDEDLPPLSGETIEPDEDTNTAETTVGDAELEELDATATGGDETAGTAVAIPLVAVMIGLLVVVAIGSVALRRRASED